MVCLTCLAAMAAIHNKVTEVAHELELMILRHIYAL